MDTVVSRLRSFWKKFGIFFTDGYFWHVQRRFTLRYMRDSGFGRRDNVLEDVIAHNTKEVMNIVINGPQTIEEKVIVRGDLIYLPHFFAVPFINGLLHIITGSTFPRNMYPDLWYLAKQTLLFQRSTNDLGGALIITPWLKSMLPEFSGFKGLSNGNQALLDFFEVIIKDAIETYDEKYDRSFLDIYIRAMKEDMKQNKRSTYSVQQLQLICTDYMFPTATAVEMVLTMLVEQMLMHPEVQEKIHEEIDRVVGRDRAPTLDDRNKMPYTEACIREMMRTETPVTLGVAHRAMVDTKLGGYDIPKNTSVSVNYVSLHMSKDIWGDPESFRPERFIVNGKLQVSSDKSLPFGAGRRLCAGETFARQGMFLVLAMFMQQFKLSTADGKPLKQASKRIQGIITTIPEFWARVTPRY
ncbi:unnamed protein product [Leptidea sinapis]|nr:unnamed protein product [Leptidea sinapis]